ncbi:uncharacterized protein LOC121344409 [Onychostruthus taczanowskii]|uniref:uncharacterized protein LOC121344409 n=1 Tax=Onychostruthus taczanowskii TaxID=356909 RepID=UPI001B806D34|nr:uncharacterized protein LOC121344409 [Onychostruthus taczanowskii]
MSPSCNLRCQCQGPWGSGLLTLHSWASSFPSNVEFCPAEEAEGRRWEIHKALCPCQQSPCPPRGKSQQGGRQGPQSWDIPGDAQSGSGQYLEPAGVQVEVAWKGPGDPRDPSPAQSSPFLLSSSCPRGHSSPWPQAGLAGLDAPGAQFSCKDWRQATMVCQRSHCLPSAVSGCPVSLRVRMAPKGLEELPQGSRSCPFLPLGCRRAPAAPQPGPEQQHTQTSASKGGETSRGCCCPGMALPGTPLSASTQWQSLEPALAFPHHPDSEHSSLPAPSQPPLPPFWIFSFTPGIFTCQHRGCSVPRMGGCDMAREGRAGH